MGKRHTLSVPGRYENIQTICQFLAAGAIQAGLTETDMFHVELACDEACTNIIEHAYGAEDRGPIEASWQVDGERFIITLHDHGRSFDPQQIPSPITVSATDVSDATLLESLREGGLGVHFMRKLMDEVHFRFEDGGNTLTLVKRIQP